jgi:hypothetical protein
LRQHSYAPHPKRTWHQHPHHKPAPPCHCPTPIILVTSARSRPPHRANST